MMQCVVCGKEAIGVCCKDEMCVGYCECHKKEVCGNGELE